MIREARESLITAIDTDLCQVLATESHANALALWRKYYYFTFIYPLAGLSHDLLRAKGIKARI